MAKENSTDHNFFFLNIGSQPWAWRHTNTAHIACFFSQIHHCFKELPFDKSQWDPKHHTLQFTTDLGQHTTRPVSGNTYSVLEPQRPQTACILSFDTNTDVKRSASGNRKPQSLSVKSLTSQTIYTSVVLLKLPQCFNRLVLTT